jgi:3-hydroxyisobutyrate dehydrogenase
MEMSTTDADEILRLAALVEATGGTAVECPVSGGCHRADTGNISIFAGGTAGLVEAVLPLLTISAAASCIPAIGTASKLKVMTNYLATVHLWRSARR